MKNKLDELVKNEWLWGYEFEDNNMLVIRYGLSSVKDTERTIFVNNGDLKSALLKSAEELESDIINSLTADNDFFGYDTKEELEDRIKEETEFLKQLSEEV